MNNKLRSERSYGRFGRPTLDAYQTVTGVRDSRAFGYDAADLLYYTPHSARHFLVLLQDRYCKNGEQRKAWSFNLGHKNEQVTLTNYAKMTPLRRDDVFSKLSF
jgi:hypothetical protein